MPEYTVFWHNLFSECKVVSELMREIHCEQEDLYVHRKRRIWKTNGEKKESLKETYFQDSTEIGLKIIIWRLHGLIISAFKFWIFHYL